jgi:hypothetical protein
MRRAASARLEEISAETRQRVDPNDDLFGPSTAPPLPEALEKQLGLKLDEGVCGCAFVLLRLVGGSWTSPKPTECSNDEFSYVFSQSTSPSHRDD